MDAVAPTSGGGTKFEPQTAEQARDLLLPQVDQIVQSVTQIPSTHRAEGRIYVEAKLLPNYLAPSYFPTELLQHVGAVPVGSRADVGLLVTNTKATEAITRRIILSIEDEGLRRLRELMEFGGSGRSETEAFLQIREFSEVALPRDKDVLRVPGEGIGDLGAHDVWEAVLHPSFSRLGEPLPLDDETLRRWFSLVETLDGHVHDGFIRRVGGLTFCPVTIDSSRSSDLARFNPLRVLRPMPSIRPRPAFGLRNASSALPPASSKPRSDRFTVGVFDGGVDMARRKGTFFDIEAKDLTTEPSDQHSLDHGTGVTGAVLYGLVRPGQVAPNPPAPVVSYRVLPPPPGLSDLYGYWVLDQIREAVVKGGHKIVNLSLGPTLAVEDDNEPNRWTSELDDLAWENDVLFVVAAGNDGEEDQALGLHRVQVPADMVNGLAVGACNLPAPEPKWRRAPYSSMGPGRHGSRIQPLGLQFGGDAGEPFEVLRADGSFFSSCGTSFAAPLTTHALANLAANLPRVNSSILRVFATHFAERHAHHKKLLNEHGYGRQPLNYEQYLECSTNEVHLLYVDEIHRGDMLAYRLPDLGVDSPQLKLRISLAYASPVDPTQATEYTTASLGLVLRPNSKIHMFNPPKGVHEKPQALDITTQAALKLLQDGWTASQEPVTQPLSQVAGSSETKLRESGKWETIRHHRVTVSAGALDHPRLEVSYVARRGGGLDRSPTSVPFAILVTIEEPNGSAQVYDTVRSKFPALKPVSQSFVPAGLVSIPSSNVSPE